MQLISTTEARKHISHIIDRVKIHGDVFGIGRRNSIDALVIQFPKQYNKDVNEITNINTISRSFDFLEDEPEMYSTSDLKKIYA
jgi:antitoxin (DNA-binding transcriptional repressor) of toxin-antitoxin stability system